MSKIHNNSSVNFDAWSYTQFNMKEVKNKISAHA